MRRVATWQRVIPSCFCWPATPRRTGDAECARCHGEEGDLHIQYLIRGQFFTKQEVDAVIVYVAGL